MYKGQKYKLVLSPDLVTYVIYIGYGTWRVIYLGTGRESLAGPSPEGRMHRFPGSSWRPTFTLTVQVCLQNQEENGFCCPLVSRSL